jgi:tryptophan synthase alpha chain
MNRIERKFRQLKKNNKKALIIYLTCGFPDLKTTEELVCLLENCQVDMIELGIPFSDPIADGPIIQRASQKALEKGIILDKVFGMVTKLRNKVDIPLVIMSYLNPIYQYNAKKFFHNCAKSGVDGVIIPDVIIEEGREFEKLANESGVDLIYFVAPVTGRVRRNKVYRHTRGFTYILSVTGITGPREKFPKELRNFLSEVRSETKKPLALGFGISNPGQVKSVRKFVDGFIIGSALIRIILNTERRKLLPEVKKFIGQFRNR